MKKSKSEPRPDSPAIPASPLGESAAAAALRLIDQTARAPAEAADGRSHHPDALEVAALKERCAAFGIDASTAELVLAGLYLLAQQTDTALEVAILQSLRADRTFARRRSKRTSGD